MSGNILPFIARGPLRLAGEPPAGEDREVWPVSELPDERECAEWLDRVVLGKAYEGTALSLWRHQPNLRVSTEKLAGFITPRWPASTGGSLLQAALEQAVLRAQEAIDQGQAFQGRLVGVYLYGLLGATADVARCAVRGEDAQGRIRQWSYFSQPLLPWSRQYGIERLLVQRIPTPPSEVVLSGLRTHMTACLTDPVDAGYLARHAAQG